MEDLFPKAPVFTGAFFIARKVYKCIMVPF